jgi:hypothetical protein
MVNLDSVFHISRMLTDDKADTQSNPPVAPEMPIVPVVIPPATPTEPVATTPTPVPPKPHDNLNVSDPF